jgi:beta-xylosidase
MSFMKQMFIILVSFILVACGKQEAEADLHNPVIPGYFADPSVVEYEGKYYMYATADPWGCDFLSCWESEDFRRWTFHQLNWPTKEACTSPLSNNNKVWAPSVVKKGNLFYMYVSVGSEIWCGKASHPLGPWENILGDKPLLSYDTTRYYHVIDAEAFIDDNGKSYLYWGSGWDWINGHCFAAELNDDMSSFKDAPVEITPGHYFEGPFMIKHGRKYYLTFSDGKTIDATYNVRYAAGDNPLGPFKEADNSPVLQTNEALNVYGPGHHTVFTLQGKNYILYHRHRLPFVPGTAFRQICMNEMMFDDSLSQIRTVVPNHVQPFPNMAKDAVGYISPEQITASSSQTAHTTPEKALDADYATRWEVASNDDNAHLTVAFKKNIHIKNMEIRFEYPWKKYYAAIESSLDGENWKTVSDHTRDGVSGSPVMIEINSVCKYIRISFVKWDGEHKPSVWEVCFTN